MALHRVSARLSGGVGVEPGEVQGDLNIVHPVMGAIAVLHAPMPEDTALLTALASPEGVALLPGLPELATLQALSAIDRFGGLDIRLIDDDGVVLATLDTRRAPGLGLARLASVPQPVCLAANAYVRPGDEAFEIRCPGSPAVIRVGASGWEILQMLMGGEAPSMEAAAFAWLAVGPGLCRSSTSVGESDSAAWTWEWHDSLFHHETRGAVDRDPRGGTFNRLVRDDVPPDARPHFEGPVIELPRAARVPSTSASFREVALGRRTRRDFDSGRTPRLEQLGAIFDLSLARSAHDTSGPIEMSLRAAPSGGGLSAFEAFVVVRECSGLAQGVYHYESDTHRLRLVGDVAKADQLARLCQQEGQWQLALLFTCTFARIGMKYERMAYSLALQNLGVLYQSIWLAAEASGLGGFPRGGVDSPALTNALGLDVDAEPVLGAMFFGVPAALVEQAQ